MPEYDVTKYTFVHRDWEKYPPRNYLEKTAKILVRVVVDPVRYLKTNIIAPHQQKYYWYHRKFARVPTIDQCYDYDVLCQWEAEKQLERDKSVDNHILTLLHDRWDHCMVYEGREKERCRPLLDAYEENQTNYFIKYGDVGGGSDYTRRIFMKQKHRMLWERRHGPVGTGKKTRHYHPDGTPYYK